MEFFTNIQRIGNRIWLRYAKDGKDYATWIDEYCPTLYVKSNTKTEFSNIFEQPLKPLRTEGIKHAREMVKQYEGVAGFELFGNPNWEYAYLFDRFGNRCKYDINQIHCAFIDIETSVGENSTGFPYPHHAAERITLITVLFKKEYHVFATGDFNCDKYNKIDLNIFKHVFDNEDDMLADFMKFWQHRKPHAVTGWNVENFDIPYIINRVRQRLGDDVAKNLSPIRNVQLSFMEDDPTQLHRVSIAGCEILDYLPMFKKYKPGERDFSLDAMAEDFLGEKKVESPTGTESFRDFYTGDFDLSLDFAPKNEVQEKALRRTILRKKYRERTASESEVQEFKDLDNWIRRECWDCFVWYNIRDVDLVKRLDMKLGMLNLTYTISYLVGMNFGDVFGTVKPWDIFLQNENHKKGVFFSVADVKGVMPRPLMGGFVHLYRAGLYKDGVTLDATSLYPSLMMTFNISPDTLVAEQDVPEDLMKYYDKLHINDFLENGIPDELEPLLRKYQLTMTLNGMFYRTDKRGFIGEIVSEVFKQRKTEKNLMLGYEDQLEKAENELKACTDPERKKVLEESIFNLDTFVQIHHNTQLALKTLMNALYGAMGQPNFRHFNFYNAEAITSSGQFGIQYNTMAVNKYVEKLCGDSASAIYNDTDSISISLQGVIDKMKVNRSNPAYIDALCKFADTNLNKQTAVACEEIANGLNVYENKLSFKREKVFLSGLYIAKKRYALLVIDEEGVRFGEPKIKVTGLEIKRSDTPLVCREAMKEALAIILSKTEAELQKYVGEFEKKFSSFEPEQIALPTGVKGFGKYSLEDSEFTKGTPIHVKAALIYNEMIRRLNLSNDHQYIMEGSKMRYVKLRLPNPTSKPVCGFIGKIPKEFDVDKYVDYEQMFEDTFAKGTRRMVEAAGWNMKYTESVEDWFE